MPSGLLLVDKPAGVRSSDCVNTAKKSLQDWDGEKSAVRDAGKPVTRVGHAGTLDSTASGLLLLLFGAATRLSDVVMALPKVYRATLCLGRATDTCDAAGQIIFEGDCRGIGELDVDRVLLSFLGWRMQRPPRISAVKLNGQPSHRRARAGEDFILKPRPVLIQSVRRVSPIREGRLEIEVLCGKGTYIRSLVRDLGERLACGAFVESLRRLSIGPFRVEDAARAAGPFPATGPGKLRPMREVIRYFHHILLTDQAEERLLKGLPVWLSGAGTCVAGAAGPFPARAASLKAGVCVEGSRMVGVAGWVQEDGRATLLPRANILLDSDSSNGGRA